MANIRLLMGSDPALYDPSTFSRPVPVGSILVNGDVPLYDPNTFSRPVPRPVYSGVPVNGNMQFFRGRGIARGRRRGYGKRLYNVRGPISGYVL